MARYDHDDPDDADDIDPEAPDASDMDRDDEPAVMPCPYCGKMISEETEICHLCGRYLSTEEIKNRVPKWIMIGTVLALVGMLWWMATFVLKGIMQ